MDKTNSSINYKKMNLFTIWRWVFNLNVYDGKFKLIIIIIIIIIIKGRQCKAEREWYTTYQSEDPSPTIPTYRQKEVKAKKSR